MTRSLGIQEESTLQNLQRLPTQRGVSFQVVRSSSDTKEQEQQKMLALINENMSFLDFAMIVEMGIKNEYPQFQGDDNKIRLIMAFFEKPRGEETINEIQFSNFVKNIKINDPPKKDRLISKFFVRNRIGKILSSTEEIENSQHLEHVIEIRSTPVLISSSDNNITKIESTSFSPSDQDITEIKSTSFSPSDKDIIEIKSTPAPQFFKLSNIVSPQSIHEVQPMFQEIEDSLSTTKNKVTITSDFFFAQSRLLSSNSPQLLRDSTQNQIENGSNQVSFQVKQSKSMSKKCCTIL